MKTTRKKALPKPKKRKKVPLYVFVTSSIQPFEEVYIPDYCSIRIISSQKRVKVTVEALE